MNIPKIFKPLPSKYLVLTQDILLPIAIIISILILSYLALFSSFFKVTDIECIHDFVPCKDENIKVELENLRNQNIFRLKSDVVMTRLKSGNYMLKEAELSKELPNKISIKLSSVSGSVAIKLKDQDTWLVLDNDYRYISTWDIDPNVPTLNITTSVSAVVGQKLKDDNLLLCLDMMKYLSKNLKSVKNYTLVDNSYLELSLENNKVAIFSPSKDIVLQLKALQSVLSDATITKSAHSIDVRFTQPVLR